MVKSVNPFLVVKNQRCLIKSSGTTSYWQGTFCKVYDISVSLVIHYLIHIIYTQNTRWLPLTLIISSFRLYKCMSSFRRCKYCLVDQSNSLVCIRRVHRWLIPLSNGSRESTFPCVPLTNYIHNVSIVYRGINNFCSVISRASDFCILPQTNIWNADKRSLAHGTRAPLFGNFDIFILGRRI